VGQLVKLRAGWQPALQARLPGYPLGPPQATSLPHNHELLSKE
jgi:hypothetical protein